MRVYLSIPISGRDINQVRSELREAAQAVAARGWEPVSPLDGVKDYTLPWVDYIIADLRTLSRCDVICFVGDCSRSPGCEIERIAARRMGLPAIGHKVGEDLDDTVIKD